MADTTTIGQRRLAHAGALTAPGVYGPVFVLAVALAAAMTLLMVPLSLPVGPMNWDLYIYFDGANRILDGQVPSIDFFVPVGPLGYYLFALGTQIFPDAQPLLLVSWSLLLVTAPLMAVICCHVATRAQGMALLLLLPFLFFALMPFNTKDFYPYPGSDGFGIYNRQVCQLLYCLMTALIFVRNGRLLAVLVTTTMLALFFLKITGFVAGGLLCLFAFAAGRISFLQGVAASIAFFAALAGIEITTGFVSAYIVDIETLVGLNSGILIARLMQSASLNFGAILPASILCLVLVIRDRRPLIERLSEAAKSPILSRRQFAAAASFVDHAAFWLGIAIVAGLFFESQNTGSQAMIFFWPILLAIVIDAARPATSRRSFFAVALLALAVALPPIVNTTERAGRTWIGAAAKSETLAHDNLKTLGQINFRPLFELRSERLRTAYIEHRDAYRRLVDLAEMPSFLIFSDYDFQIGWLKNVDRAINAIHAYEAENNVRFETILAMDFTNPFPWLMDRSGVRHVSIAADPYRTVPEPDADVVAAVGDVDLALRPTCPIHHANTQLTNIYESALTNHTKIELTPCYTAYIKNGL